ncbi:MAG: tandem-95 repeat protein [Ardenticatenaceae bacterium]|nr:tandem-95 repeat protein [Ardenticatenaceae bacterium]MCB8948639.1 tandem-95 repeat protein [Ardenticatenaceae bacterium]
MKLFRNGHQATAVLVVCLMLFLFFLGMNLVVKAASPGDLDGTFGFGLSGITYTDIGTASLDEAHAVALLSDGTFIVGGASDDDFALVKYTDVGAVDTSFGSSGKVVTNISGSNVDLIEDLVIQSDGSIVAVGTSTGTNSSIAVVRYSSSGALDSGFGSSGIVNTTLGGTFAMGTAVALQTNGQIIIGGTRDDDFVVARLNSSDGSLDTTFNSTGYNTADFTGRADEGHGLVIQSSGAIVIGGFANQGDDQDFGIARFTSSGALDSSFGSSGIATADPSGGSNDLAYALAEQSTGALVLAGFSEMADEETTLARFTADGVLDTTFGSSGTVVTSNPGLADFTYDLAVQPTDKLVVIGFTQNGAPNNEDFRVARYNGDGTLDSNFGGTGIVYTDIGTVLSNGNHQDEAYAVAVQPDNRIIVVGLTDVTSGDKNFAVARYESQNNAPTLLAGGVIGNEDSNYTFSSTDFSNNFDDPDGDSLIQVQITALPANGSLQLSGSPVAANDVIPVAEIANLTFTPVADWFGSSSLTWNGFDGIDYAASTAALSITINAVNDAPSFTRGTDQTVAEDAGLQTVTGWASNMNLGPANESGQTGTFVVSSNNTTLFPTPPAIDAVTGDLTFTPAANVFGSATITVRLQDDGGTANGGVNLSPAQTFFITVTSVNDAPTFSNSGNVTVNEDSGAQTVAGWASNISPGPFGEDAQGLEFTVSSNNNGLFSSPPAVSLLTGNLTFTPVADQSGTAQVTVTLSDDGGTANGGQNSSQVIFILTVNPVNDAPTFTGGGNQQVLEDAGAQSVANWASSMNTGSPNESGQTLTFVLTTNNDALFDSGPAVNATTGTLTYTPAANANGSATVTAVLQDSGGTLNGGVDTSAPHQFTITVTAVNDAPSFTAGADQHIDEENGGAYEIVGWASNISAGAANESGQTLTFDVSHDNAALFVVPPAIDATTGNLTFTTISGSGLDLVANVSVMLTDNGGTANGGVDSSATQQFTISLTFVNDAPSFLAGADQTVEEDSGPITVAGWASAIDPGSATEGGQTLTFLTSNDNNSLFAVQPSVDDATGDLTFTPAADAFGVATVSVQLQDNGGTANGGQDTSAAQTFLITISPINDAPTVAAFTLTGVENSALAFTAVSFTDNFNDVDNDSLQSIRISSLPANGSLTLSGTPVALNQVIPVGQLGNLAFMPDLDWTGDTSFSWTGFDGTVYAVETAVVTLTIEPDTFTIFLPLVVNGN